MNKPTSHHILARGSGGSNHKENKVILPENRHRALHILFEIQTISEQIRTILDISDTAIQGDFKNDIEEILIRYEGLEYHHGIKK